MLSHAEYNIYAGMIKATTIILDYGSAILLLLLCVGIYSEYICFCHSPDIDMAAARNGWPPLLDAGCLLLNDAQPMIKALALNSKWKWTSEEHIVSHLIIPFANLSLSLSDFEKGTDPKCECKHRSCYEKHSKSAIGCSEYQTKYEHQYIQRSE